MAKNQAKVEDIIIPIFDFLIWKIRLKMMLEYKECLDPAIVEAQEKDKTETWKKKDLKARTILVSTILDRQLEYIGDCETSFDML